MTCHRSETIIRKKEAGVEEKMDVTKRLGTVGICAAIMNHDNVMLSIMWRIISMFAIS